MSKQTNVLDLRQGFELHKVEHSANKFAGVICRFHLSANDLADGIVKDRAVVDDFVKQIKDSDNKRVLLWDEGGSKSVVGGTIDEIFVVRYPENVLEIHAVIAFNKDCLFALEILGTKNVRFPCAYVVENDTIVKINSIQIQSKI